MKFLQKINRGESMLDQTDASKMRETDKLNDEYRWYKHFKKRWL